MSRKQIDAVGDRIALISSEIDAATHELLTQLRAFDEASGWYYQGALSCAHWFSWRAGVSMGPAREKVRVANKLGELQKIDAVLRVGKLSYSKVRALTRVATLDNEEQLLEIAAHSTASQLEKICRLYRSQTQNKPSSAEDSEERRWVTSRGTDNGMVRIQIQLPAEEATMVLEAMSISAETRNRADGVMAMASAALAGDGARTGKPPVEVMIHVDAATLAGHTAQGDGISAEIAKRLLCDCGVVPTLEDDAGRVIDVGRKRRTIGPAIRRALVARDEGCRFPSCTNTICDAHHVEHWIDDGETHPRNLLLVCRRHHKYVHEHDFRVELDDDGTARFYDPHNRLIPAVGEKPKHAVGTLDGMRARHRDQDIHIDPNTAHPTRNDRPVDYHWIVNRLL